jgi:hypothetical protein
LPPGQYRPYGLTDPASPSLALGLAVFLSGGRAGLFPSFRNILFSAWATLQGVSQLALASFPPAVAAG